MLALLLTCAAAIARVEESVCQKDVAFALSELEKQRGVFFEPKKIDWKQVEKDFAAGVDTLIERADALLSKFPQDKVPYKAEQIAARKR